MDETLGFNVASMPVNETTIEIVSGNNGLIRLSLITGEQKLTVELDHEMYSQLVANLQLAEVVKRKFVDRGHYASNEGNEE